MGVVIGWEDDSKRVMRFSLDENWTWDEFFAAKSESYDLINSVAHKVGVIVDIASRTGLHPNLLSNTRKALGDRHPNTFVVVIVVSQALARTTISMLYDAIRFSSIRVEIVSSLDEAHRIIDQRLQALHKII